MFAQFFKILVAIIIVKVTGYALIVTLLQDKLAMAPFLRFFAATLLCGNFFLVWMTFQRGRNHPWPLLASILNLGLVAGLITLTSL
jgi:uncharacterized membrane protein HdeD (DUF308 family)